VSQKQPPKFGMQGQARPSDLSGDYNALVFVIKQILNRASISAVCKVKAVRGGGIGQMGYVDLQPLLNQVDGYGDTIPPGILHNVPFFRLQSGSSAVIIDPQVNDVGVAVFSDRDISAIKFQYNNGTMAQLLIAGANPNSYRRFDVADGLFFGGFFNGTPTQYIQFISGKIVINSPTEVDINSPLINLSSWIGLIAPFGMGTPPAGWLACPTAQTLVSTTTYAALFAAISYTWGGSGANFGLPFFPSGYVPIAGTAGVLSHGALLAHTHPWGKDTTIQAGSNGTAAERPSLSAPNTTGVTSSTGGTDNLAAGYGVQWCVKY
jgi:microcystin-dependent protein